MSRFGVRLPTLHADQVRAFRLKEDPRGGEWEQNAGGQFKVVRCGRRWGKSMLGETWICDGAAKGKLNAWFAPDFKTLTECYEEIVDILEPGIKRSKQNTVIRLKNGGRIDFWSLENERAGRSRKYDRTFIDEAAFTKPNMMDIWKRSIKPTLFDRTGKCLVGSNTNGVKPDNFMWQICNQPEHGFIEYHAPTINNPTIPELVRGETEEQRTARRHLEIAKLKAREHPLVFQQEYEAEFVDFSGVAFFTRDQLLEGDQPIDVPTSCDAVFATIDTAVKTGSKNDGTAVCYWARTKTHGAGYPLVLLGWDIIQIQGDLLETWLTSVFDNLQYWAGRCGARFGSLGAFIEDKSTGMVLIMAAQRRGLPAHAIDSVLTSLGKDERAISVSGYHYRGEVKITGEAYTKTMNYKGQTANHFISQVCGFKIGVKDQADDLLDTYTYGLAIGLGDSEGI